jgi:hypothetical protein
MPYIGNEVGNRFVASKAASVYSGDGSTTAFTLEHAVGSDEDILVSVDGVIQEPSVAYAVSSGTTLTFTAAPSSNSGNNIFVYYLFRTVATVDHPSTSALTATSGTFTGDVTVDTDTLKVDSTNDRVGINTTAMSSYYAKDFVVSSSDEGGMTIVAENTGHQNYIMFADGTSGAERYRGYIGYEHNGDIMQMTSGGSSKFIVNDSAIAMNIDSTGAITKPLQPAFLADCNYTGSGLAINTTHTVPALNERFDQNGDYNTSTYTFTAPVTGKYQLNGHFYVHAFDDTTNYVQFFITTSNRTYAGIIDNTLTSADVDNYNNSISVLADMDVNDTAKLQLNIPNSGAAQMAVSNLMNFSGYLVA